jgi:hypothetical protein
MTTDCSWNYHENYKRRTWAEHVLPMFYPCSAFVVYNLCDNLLSYFGLVDARISASEKDVLQQLTISSHQSMMGYSLQF